MQISHTRETLTMQREQTAEQAFRDAVNVARKEKTWTTITNAMEAWNTYCAIRDENRRAHITAPSPAPTQIPLAQLKRVLDGLRDTYKPKTINTTKIGNSKSKSKNRFGELIDALTAADTVLTQHASLVNVTVWDCITNEAERDEMLGDISELRRNLPLLIHFLRSVK